MVTLYERVLDPNAGTERIANLWWAMAVRGASAIILVLIFAA